MRWNGAPMPDSNRGAHGCSSTSARHIERTSTSPYSGPETHTARQNPRSRALTTVAQASSSTSRRSVCSHDSSPSGRRPGQPHRSPSTNQHHLVVSGHAEGVRSVLCAGRDVGRRVPRDGPHPSIGRHPNGSPSAAGARNGFIRVQTRNHACEPRRPTVLHSMKNASATPISTTPQSTSESTGQIPASMRSATTAPIRKSGPVRPQ